MGNKRAAVGYFEALANYYNLIQERNNRQLNKEKKEQEKKRELPIQKQIHSFYKTWVRASGKSISQYYTFLGFLLSLWWN